MSVPAASLPPGDGVRLFFALRPPEPVREALAAAGAVLPLAAPARLVARENYHLTIAFIGTVPVPALERVRRIGQRLRASAFTIEIDTYEFWPKPEVVVIAARTIEPPLQALWDALHRDLAADGFELRAKQLRPHVTLLRHVKQAPPLPELRPFSWRARDLCLYRSGTVAKESVYTVLDTWSLLDETARA
ncbi:MAG: RNA 2',3'-cyclic phosphodiesterase [Steroidobacterales bacterium]